MDGSPLDCEKSINELNEKLKISEEKLNNILSLIYKTFTGNSSAAQKLSEIVGVPAPIVSKEGKQKSPKTIELSKPQSLLSYPEANSKLASRMDFLDQVMFDHDIMMKPNYQKTMVLKTPLMQNIDVKMRRAQSADRSHRVSEHLFFNPYTWNLNDHTNANETNLYKAEFTNAFNLCRTKALVPKSVQSRPMTTCTNFSDMKVDHILQTSESRRTSKLSNIVVPRDYKLTYERDISVEKSPQCQRPRSTLSYRRHLTIPHKRKSTLMTPFHNLPLQIIDDIYDNNSKSMDSSENKNQIRTIDLQRRLGIPEAGLVAP